MPRTDGVFPQPTRHLLMCLHDCIEMSTFCNLHCMVVVVYIYVVVSIKNYDFTLVLTGRFSYSYR